MKYSKILLLVIAIILAGMAWNVISIDEERKTIHVNQTKSSKIPLWNGEGGDIDSKVIQRIKKVVQEDVIYPYLQKMRNMLLRYHYSHLLRHHKSAILPNLLGIFHYCFYYSNC